MAAAATVAAGAPGPAAPAAAACTPGSGSAGPGAQGMLIGDRLYSGVLITLENCLLPDDKLRFTPSMSSGLDTDTETDLRVVGCELIQAAGILLRLPQVAMATGQVLFQRFFYTKSFVKHSMEHVSMACVHLASKIEEAPRRIRDVINVFHRLRHLREKKKPVPLLLDQDYVNLKNQIIKAERRVLKELGFCVHVKHPHKIIVMYLQVLECERNQHLVQTSWNYMNDSLRTDVFVRFQPESIACACIYLAARTLEIPLPNRPHWFLLFGATEEEIQEICLKILQLYTRKKVDLTHLESEVEKRRHAIEEAKAQARGLLPAGTQALDNASGFSPAPKLAESPKEGKGNKASPLSVRNAKRKTDGVKKIKADSPVNGLPKGRGSRSRSGSREQSYSRSPSRSASPKRRKSDSGSTSGGSKSQSRSRSRSDSPPRQAHRGAPYKGSKPLERLGSPQPRTMLLVRLTPLLRAVPRAGCSRPWPASGLLGRRACRPCYSTQPARPSGVASIPGKRFQLELEEMLVPRKMSISPLESWLSAHYLLPRLEARASGTLAPSQLYECPPSQVGQGAEQGMEEVWDAPQMQCKNVLKIRRRKMNHHKYRKLVKRTRFLRRKVREGRLRRKQIKFERDLRRIWLKAGLKEAPAGWQTPKIYLKGK